MPPEVSGANGFHSRADPLHEGLMSMRIARDVAAHGVSGKQAVWSDRATMQGPLRRTAKVNQPPRAPARAGRRSVLMCAATPFLLPDFRHSDGSAVAEAVVRIARHPEGGAESPGSITGDRTQGASGVSETAGKWVEGIPGAESGHRGPFATGICAPESCQSNKAMHPPGSFSA